MKLLVGAVLLLAAVVYAQDSTCTCAMNRLVTCGGTAPSNCTCSIPLSETVIVDCNKLIPKCWLMKMEALTRKGGRRPKHEFAVVDNDGLYNPDCEANGSFKARQCNGTDTCWCVDSAGVRRTDKKDQNLKCDHLVRTSWIEVRVKLNGSAPANAADFITAFNQTITKRYGLPGKNVAVIELEEGTFVYVDLKQNKSEIAPTDPDIADVAYYLEKDIKGVSVLPLNNPFNILVGGQSVGVTEPLISYIDDERPELSMKSLSAGIIAVIVVLLVAIVAGIVILVLTRRKRGQYQKAESKEMGEMQKELTS